MDRAQVTILRLQQPQAQQAMPTIPGVPPERNLNGISFAVANMSGFVARVREAAVAGSIDEIVRWLAVRGSDA